MPTDRSDERDDALDVLAGEWTVQAGIPDVPPGRVVFEWDLDRAFLVQRSAIPKSVFPSSLSLIARDATTGGFTQHYFDSRGVVRLYRMSLQDGVWTLLHTEPDFSPLDFAKRFEGTFGAGGSSIDGRWETSSDGGTTWELDFPLTYTRIS